MHDSSKKEIRKSRESVTVYEPDGGLERGAVGTENRAANSGQTKVERDPVKDQGHSAEEMDPKSLGSTINESEQRDFDSDESVHLLVDEQMEFNVSRGRGHREVLDPKSITESEIIQDLKKEAVNSFIELKRDLLEQYLELRNQVLRGQRTTRVVSQIATANLLLMGMLNCVFGLISINLLAVLISIYIMFISVVILMLEISKKRRIRHVEAFAREWFKFLDLSAGRGFIQILLCTISLYLTQSMYFSLMSLFVGFTGMLNIAFGVMAACKLRKIINILKYYGSKDLEDLGLRDNIEISPADLENIKISKDQDPEYKLKRIHRLFSTLDEDGNGQIDQEDLYNGLKSLKLPFTLSRSEIEVIFDHFDKDSNNMISIQEFEHWFISNKCPYFIL